MKIKFNYNPKTNSFEKKEIEEDAPYKGKLSEEDIKFIESNINSIVPLKFTDTFSKEFEEDEITFFIDKKDAWYAKDYTLYIYEIVKSVTTYTSNSTKVNNIEEYFAISLNTDTRKNKNIEEFDENVTITVTIWLSKCWVYEEKIIMKVTE